ncbi:22779_t:CDS:1, partial [Racocetra persica]
RKLLQEFIVNAWAATKPNRLRFLHKNQDILRANIYQRLTDIVGKSANEK